MSAIQPAQPSKLISSNGANISNFRANRFPKGYTGLTALPNPVKADTRRPEGSSLNTHLLDLLELLLGAFVPAGHLQLQQVPLMGLVGSEKITDLGRCAPT